MHVAVAQRALAWFVAALSCLASSNAAAQCDDLRSSLQTLESTILDQEFDLELATARIALVEKYRHDHALPSYRADLYDSSRSQAEAIRQSRNQKRVSADRLRQQLQDECPE